MMRTSSLVACTAIITFACLADPRLDDASSADRHLPGDDVRTILAAWRERQEHIATALVNWTEGRSEAAGSLIPTDPSLPSGPSQDAQWNTDCRLAVSGKKFRLELEGPAWYFDLGDLRRRRNLSSFDGTEARMYNDPSDAGKPATGTVFSTDRNPVLLGVENRAVCWFLRPLEPGFAGLQEASVHLTDRPAEKDGRPCLVLNAVDAGNLAWELWVDPGLAFQIVRAHFRDKNGLEYRLDIAYQSDEPWSLVGWQMQSLRNGVLQRNRTGTISSLEINHSVAEAELAVQFPVGIYVADQREKADYIVRESGGRRPVLRYERMLPHDQLVNSEPGEADAAHYSVPWMWIAIVASMIAVAAAVTVLRRRSSNT